MLADSEDESVIAGEAVTLGLDDVKVVALGVRGGVAGEEGIRGVLAAVADGKREG